jgi:ElaB/YqjD/DUF883 family membrane-anchored ribosome-binding protein
VTLILFVCSFRALVDSFGKQNRLRERKQMTTQEANARLAQDLKSLVHDAEELMKATAGQAGEKVRELRTRLAAALEAAKVSCQRAEEKTIAAAKATDRTIREHPYESLGIAFGVGLLVGVLVARK